MPTYDDEDPIDDPVDEDYDDPPDCEHCECWSDGSDCCDCGEPAHDFDDEIVEPPTIKAKIALEPEVDDDDGSYEIKD